MGKERKSSQTVTRLFQGFFQSEKSGGVVLVCCTILSLILANSAWAESYLHIWHTKIAGEAIEYWINDGLMVIFFLLVGLELKREVIAGELSSLKNASLPIFGALGGMLIPAGIFLALNYGGKAQAGAGIPMATDIAFAVGILSLLGNRVPTSLKVFLTALAVIDDLGAILVIAIFYSGGLDWINLLAALGIFIGLFVLNRLKIKSLLIYLLGGVGMWYFMLHSGIHATITGVLLALVIPFGDGSEETPAYRLQHFLHLPVAFLVMPIFALANTGIAISTDFSAHLFNLGSLGIILGLVVGKPFGIWLFAFVSTKLGIAEAAADISWKQLFAVACLGGIGFTMSIFITLLAFDDAALINDAKIAILLSSVMAGLLGYVSLYLVLNRQPKS